MIRRLAAALSLSLLPVQADALCLCLKCVTGPFRHYSMTASSMEPGLPTGACFTVKQRMPGEPLPGRGRVIAFLHPETAELHVMRLIGLPGDEVQMRDGRLWLNGAEVAQAPAPDFVVPLSDPRSPGHHRRCGGISGDDCRSARARETLPGGVSYEVLDLGRFPWSDESAAFLVPPGHVFVLGDNRDNAMDSRYGPGQDGPGMIPDALVTGIFDTILHP